MTQPESPDRTGVGVGPALFAATIFASALLIFLVQPLVGKRILPWFGGVASVWALCLAFFQVALFAGYLYAHLLIRFLSAPAQLVVHAGGVAASLLALPVLPDASWMPQSGDDPRWRVLAMLTAVVAPPYLVLASTGPLLQAWFTRRHPDRSPYPLYALSNAGSLLALVAYPFAIEPNLGLSRTGALWSGAFAVTGVAIVLCAVAASRVGARAPVPAHASVGQGLRTSDALLWTALSASAVIVMMGASNHLTSDVASVPFLWILPLATYLLTLILCFASEAWYRRGPWVFATVAVALATRIEPVYADTGGLGSAVTTLGVQIPLYCALVFGVCTVLHGELYRLRPPVHSLTAFFLCVSGGGALGGLFVGLAAPALFVTHSELGAGVVAALALVLLAWAREEGGVLASRHGVWRRVVACAVAVSVGGYAAANVGRAGEGLVHRERGFFGSFAVFEGGEGQVERRQFNHGGTMHGVQFLHPDRVHQPTTYYGVATGIGLVLSLRKSGFARRVGLIGLGIGTLATYGEPEETFRFYEIDPAVARVAQDTELFTFLSGSRAQVEVAVGDGRLLLAEEVARAGGPVHDFLVVDAFSSGSIPVHLLTREAFELYAAALDPTGLLAFHVSNRHFDLPPLVARMAGEVGMHALHVKTLTQRRRMSEGADWMIVTRQPGLRAGLAGAMRQRAAALGMPPEALTITALDPEDVGHVRPWTDDYSDLFGVLKARR